ncbi:hypothetical protein EJB05_15822, partial [Eragrostis curvula]
MGDRGQGKGDPVWDHGENVHPGFICKYCKLHRKGGGATRLKQHLGCRGKGVLHCNEVPQEVRDFFRGQLDKTVEKKKNKEQENLRREEIAREGNVNSDEDEELQAAILASRQEAAYATQIREQGGQYEHGGGSSQAGGSQGGGLLNMLRRSTSRKGTGAKEATKQTRIDTGPWSAKGKIAKSAIGRAWAKFYHAEAINGSKADNPYFAAAIKETQLWGKDIPSPTGREIDGIYLDQNEEEIKKQLNPRTHYAYGTSQSVMNDVREAFEFMTDTDTCVRALHEFESYRRKFGSFSTDLAQKMAFDTNTSPAQWWSMFGGDTPTLRKLALRLVSQCCSSSGCERNWSTFALIHTKVRNRLSYKKLHKLVYVNYNLRIRLRQAGMWKQQDEDPFHKLMELSLYDSSNPIRDWMENGRSNAEPLLDEEETESDAPMPSRLVIQDDDPRELQRITGTSSLAEWADTNVGETHIGKRKHQAVTAKEKGKKKQKQVRSDESTASEDARRSPTYQESNDSSSKSSSDGATADGGNASIASPSPIHFTGETYFTHATQDQDHGAPNSQRTTVTERGRGRQHHHGGYLSPQESDTSGNYTSGSSNSYYSYSLADPTTQPTQKVVYQWEDPDFYNMLMDQWRTTAAWTGQTWLEYKAELLATQGLVLMS